jgi:hypothetical protein
MTREDAEKPPEVGWEKNKGEAEEAANKSAKEKLSTLLMYSNF